jgi:hypothetical protein
MSLTALVKIGMTEKADEHQRQNNFLSRAVEAIVGASGIKRYPSRLKLPLFLTLCRIIVRNKYHLTYCKTICLA